MLNANEYTYKYTVHTHTYPHHHHKCNSKTLDSPPFSDFPENKFVAIWGFITLAQFCSWLGVLLLMFHLFNAILYRFIAVAVSWYCRVCAVLRLTKYIDFLLTSYQFCLCWCCCICTWSALVTGYWFKPFYFEFPLAFPPHSITTFVSMNFSSMVECEMWNVWQFYWIFMRCYES